MESNEKKFKIKSKIAYEEEIGEEKKRVTINSLALGITALSSIICFSSMGSSNLELSQKIGMFFLGMISSSGGISSLKALISSISKKAKLEGVYDIYYNVDKHIDEGKRGRSR